MAAENANVDLLDSHVCLRQCQLAVEALHKHQLKVEKERQENELLPSKEQFVWLVLTVKKIHPKMKIMPFRMYVPSACVFFF